MVTSTRLLESVRRPSRVGSTNPGIPTEEKLSLGYGDVQGRCVVIIDRTQASMYRSAVI